MRLTVGELQKWLTEADSNWVVTVSENEFINITNPATEVGDGMSIWIGDDEPLLPDGVELVK